MIKIKNNLLLFNKSSYQDIPHHPGIYIFCDKNKSIIYIGKAKSLKNRIGTYLNKNLLGKTGALISNIKYFKYIQVTSEFEAILLESKLIKKFQPKYNIDLKDGKSYLFIYITNEKYSRIIVQKKILQEVPIKHSFGPFINTKTLYSILKIIRKIIPYSTHRPQKKPCLEHQLGLCNPCPSQIENCISPNEKTNLSKRYKNNITCFKNIFYGNHVKLLNYFQRQMSFYAKTQEFETADTFKSKIEYLKYLLKPPDNLDLFLDDQYYSNHLIEKENEGLNDFINNIFSVKIRIFRIECFDVSHFQREYTTASMVTFINGIANKQYYRRFKLKQKILSDTSSLEEIAIRRSNHFDDWGKPDLIIVDGGKPQVGTFNKVFNKYNIPVIGLAKRYETIVIQNMNGHFSEYRVKNEFLKLLQRIRDESHRFAQKYHHFLFSKNMLTTGIINYEKNS